MIGASSCRQRGIRVLTGLVMGCGAALAQAQPYSPGAYVASGEVSEHSATLWGRCNGEVDAYLVVQLSRDGRFGPLLGNFARRGGLGPFITRVTADSDYTASVQVPGLQPGTRYHYRVSCIPDSRPRSFRQQAEGTFQTAPLPTAAAAVRFTWGADLAGQGWGQNDELEITRVDGETVRGGYVIFDTIASFKPDFVIHQGDNIYADGAIPAEKSMPEELGGGIWTNHRTKDFVAVSLDDFRANWKYNLQDRHFRRILATVPGYFQWDDHEVSNNWYPGEILSQPPYSGLSANVLAERAQQSFYEYTPLTGRRIFRNFRYGQNLEVFLLDERSFRGPNTGNLDPAGNEMLGAEQLDWLKRNLKNSAATWKVISTHDPLGIVVRDGEGFDSFSNGDAAVLGRERQLAEILKFIKDEKIGNVVFITSDVHYAAAIAYEPARATFQDFLPFYEFVIGPLHAGAFGPGELDPSFGPEYEYVRAPATEGLPANSPPPHLDSFGLVEVDEAGVLTVRLVDISGAILFEKTLPPAP